MPQPCCNDRVSELATSLVTCLRSTLEACEAPACRVSLVSGVEAPLDVCCECCTEDGSPADGQAWVRVDSIYPSDQVPIVNGSADRCEHGWAVRFEIGVARCHHTLNDDGTPPCEADMNLDAMKVMRDANLMRQALACCFLPTEDIDCGAWLIGPWVPLPTSGGCGGGTMTIDVSFVNFRCRPDAE